MSQRGRGGLSLFSTGPLDPGTLTPPPPPLNSILSEEDMRAGPRWPLVTSVSLSRCSQPCL